MPVLSSHCTFPNACVVPVVVPDEVAELETDVDAVVLPVDVAVVVMLLVALEVALVV
jgi:hypothetical protein